MTRERVDGGFDVGKDESREGFGERFSKHGVTDQSLIEIGRRANSLGRDTILIRLE